jgi:peptidyl-dipeptidase Dcp
MKTTNPLLSPFDTFDQTVPFELIGPTDFVPALKAKVKHASKELKKVFRSKETPSFQNTILPLELHYDEISRIGLILFNLNSAATNADIQRVTQIASPMITRFMTRMMLNNRLFKRVNILYTNRLNENLSDEEVRLTELTYNNMKRNGANLSLFMKWQLVRIQMKLSKLTLKFNDNVLEETNRFELILSHTDDMAGLPTDVMESARQNAKSKGKDGWLFTLQYPDYAQFMKYAKNRKLRERMHKAYTSRGNCGNQYDNKKLIDSIIKLRLKQAKLLGYHCFSDYVLEERMAGNTNEVTRFTDRLLEASMSFARKEMDELKAFALANGLIEPLMPWDFSFYSEKLKAEKYGFDELMIKPYLQLENVVDAVFQLATRLYGITFVKIEGVQVYHPDVEVYKVLEQSGEYLAVLYLDHFPRENKQGGAWMTEYRAQSNIGGEMKRPHISICCNFTKPTANQPSLLTFNEASTFLHEFGHALHGIFANTVFPSVSGTNVFRDFVELPSQLMENWLTETEWLQQFAVHYNTAEPIPDQLVDQLVNARNFQAGYNSARQLNFAVLDMAWHTSMKTFNGKVVEFEREHTQKTKFLPEVEGSCISTSFGHIFGGGYAAGYYSYKWAEVLDADAFSLFKEKGIFDKELAQKFRKEVLERGGTADPNLLYQNFRGREANIGALLERSGLK